MDFFQEKKGEAFLFTHDDICKTTTCVILAILFNKQHSYTDPEIQEIAKEVDLFFKSFMSVGIKTLRILARYDAKIRPPDTFCPIIL